MGRVCFAVCCAGWLLAPLAGAVDLAGIERSIGKLPELTSSSPEYCLLVIGLEANKRVWLVRDGAVLYVDRNGNGDLTEPDERVAADPENSNSDEQVFYFQAGEISDGPTSHKDLRVSWSKVDHLLKHDYYRAILDKIESPRACRVSLDVAMPGQRGSGVDGRVQQSASLTDDRGWLQFGSQPDSAPIVHFGGPWEVRFSGNDRWRIGRTKEVYLVFGTPGLGPGTMTCTEYEGIIPPSVKPRLRVLYPNADAAGEPIAAEYEFTRRCCTVNLYGDVHVPDGVGTGTAKVEVSLESWPGGYVAPSVTEVEILPAQPGPKYEPVSPRLVSKLEHSRPNGAIVNIRYSPDGARLIAGTYPGGIIHVWDVASGERLVTIDAGEGYHASLEYFCISPDWQTALVPRRKKGAFTRVERNGKTLNHVEYSDLVYVYDLNSGKRLREFQASPPRGIVTLRMTPDGSRFFTLDEVSGDFDGVRPRALSLWTMATGEHRQVETGSANVYAYSPDGQHVAMSMPYPIDEQYFHKSIDIVTVPDLKKVCSIPIDHERAYGSATCFALDGAVVAGTISWLQPDVTPPKFDSVLKLWDTTTGEEVYSLPRVSMHEAFRGLVASPDGRSLVVTTLDMENLQGRLYVVDAERRSVRATYESDAALRGAVFHPSGSWIAVAKQTVVKTANPRDDSVDLLPQPSVLAIDVNTCEILEEALATQTHMTSMVFSPDGQTLATSGDGEVLLWDYRAPPGKLSNVATK